MDDPLTFEPNLVPTKKQSTAVDLTAGTIAGVAQIVTGHPFDTIKVKLQNMGSGKSMGALGIFRETVQSQGVYGIYRGMGAPLITVAAFNAVYFATNEQLKKFMLKHNHNNVNTRLSLGEQFFCGFGTGLFATAISAPTELIKCKLQVMAPASSSAPANSPVTATISSSPSSTFNNSSIGSSSSSSGSSSNSSSNNHNSTSSGTTVTKKIGPIYVVKEIIRTEGYVGLTRGYLATTIRESVGAGFSFAVYNASKNYLCDRYYEGNPNKVSDPAIILAGGLGGIGYWFFIYPIDVIKTRIQVHTGKIGMIQVAKEIVATKGMQGLFQGLGICSFRAFLVNAAGFWTFETAKKLLDKI